MRRILAAVGVVAGCTEVVVGSGIGDHKRTIRDVARKTSLVGSHADQSLNSFWPGRPDILPATEIIHSDASRQQRPGCSVVGRKLDVSRWGGHALGAGTRELDPRQHRTIVGRTQEREINARAADRCH